MPGGNRYSPPKAAVTDGPVTLLSKPKGVLALQVLAGLLALLLAYGMSTNLLDDWRDNMHWVIASRWEWYARRFALMLASVGLIFLLQWRSQFARWSGVAWLAFVMLTPLLGVRPNFSMASAHVIKEYLITMAIGQPLLALVVYFAAFSRKARAYFSSAATKLPATEASDSTPAPS
jgi:hypothetical protein